MNDENEHGNSKRAATLQCSHPRTVSSIIDCPWQGSKRCLWTEPMNVTQAVRFERELRNYEVQPPHFTGQSCSLTGFLPLRSSSLFFILPDPGHTSSSWPSPSWLSPCKVTLQSQEYSEILGPFSCLLLFIPPFFPFFLLSSCPFLPLFPYSSFLSLCLHFMSYTLNILFTPQSFKS